MSEVVSSWVSVLNWFGLLSLNNCFTFSVLVMYLICLIPVFHYEVWMWYLKVLAAFWLICYFAKCLLAHYIINVLSHLEQQSIQFHTKGQYLQQFLCGPGLQNSDSPNSVSFIMVSDIWFTLDCKVEPLWSSTLPPHRSRKCSFTSQHLIKVANFGVGIFWPKWFSLLLNIHDNIAWIMRP